MERPRDCGLYRGLVVSILVLLDLGLELKVGCSRHGNNALFQSLFCWILGWIRRYRNSKINAARVSILVLLDLGLELIFRQKFGRWLNAVSILVLLDLGLEHTENVLQHQPAPSFNPCSAGSWVGTVAAAYSIGEWLCFNPCSAGSWVGTDRVVGCHGAATMFQSLFCWILGWNEDI